MATGDIILCTDADCEMGEVGYKRFKLFLRILVVDLFPPKFFKSDDNLFSKYQQLELLSLVSTSV